MRPIVVRQEVGRDTLDLREVPVNGAIRSREAALCLQQKRGVDDRFPDAGLRVHGMRTQRSPRPYLCGNIFCQKADDTAVKSGESRQTRKAACPHVRNLQVMDLRGHKLQDSGEGIGVRCRALASERQRAGGSSSGIGSLRELVVHGIVHDHGFLFW